VINDRNVCQDHIDWAMSRAFQPVKEAFDKVFGEDAPVEPEIVMCPKHPGVNVARSPCPMCEVGL
jgi:hypothetical protein